MTAGTLCHRYGASRTTIATLDKAWRPWEPTPGKIAETRDSSSGSRPGKAKAARASGGSKGAARARPAEEVVNASVKGVWTAAPGKVKMSSIGFDAARVSTPAASPPLSAPAAVVVPPPAVPLVRCEVPLLRFEADAWPEGSWRSMDLTKSKHAFESMSWITERLALPAPLRGWAQIELGAALDHWAAGDSPNDACAPRMPKMHWVAQGRQVVAMEDPVQAGAYEQRLKRRPPAFVVDRRIDAAKGASAAVADVVGQLRISANPLALGMQALSELRPSGLAKEAVLDWRLVEHSDTVPCLRKLPKLALSSNKKDAAAPQPEHFCKFPGRPHSLPPKPLRPEQQRSLSWMVEQEGEDTPAFTEVEVAEGVLSALRWRLEARARMPRVVRGGVLADEVGYGKTVITIALIDSMPRVPRPPPSPLRADGLIPTKTTLVLAPSHLLKQWPKEVDKFTGGALKCLTFSTMTEINRTSIKEVQSCDVIVCSITLLRNDLYVGQVDVLLPSKST